MKIVKWKVINLKKNIILLASLFFLAACSAKEAIVLKNDVFDSEYGNTISQSIVTYVDLEKSDEEIVKKGKLNFDGVTYEKDKNHPTLGVHKVKIQFEDEVKELTIRVRDTKAPKFIKRIDTITTYAENPINEEKLKKEFEARDVDDVVFELDEANVDYNKPGEYSTKLTAKDSSGNKTVIDVKVVVKEVTFEVNKRELNLHPGETFKLTVKKDGLKGDIKFTSSNVKVATVDKDGNVVALSDGIAKINVECGGKKREVTVNVESAQVEEPTYSQNTSIQTPNQSSGNQNSNQSSENQGTTKPSGGSSSGLTEDKKDDDKESSKGDSGNKEEDKKPESKPKPEEKPEENPEAHVHADASEWVIMMGDEWWDNSKWFNSYEELDAWASNFHGPNNDWGSHAYVTIECKKCGQVLPIFYDIEKIN